MVFSSYVFILIFLPAAWLGFEIARRRLSARAAFGWLVIASFIYFGYWNPVYLPLLFFSILFNFYVGAGIASEKREKPSKPLLIFGIVVNLVLLAWFKYANFFSDTVEALTGFEMLMVQVVLPIGISFFTFQQVAYLVDAYRGLAKEYDFLEYALFVTFFPQLIAGPIVHHSEMIPQFLDRARDRRAFNDLSIGMTIFAIGLGKKVILADQFALWANPVFNMADAGVTPSMGEAWIGTLAYTLQLYFDFSGYSDMAIGIARMFGIVLPLNFFSPYKSTSIVDFWRRWHITLSRFLRDYLYIPLGGNRKGPGRRYVNLITTMLLGGLWHGAGWTFVVWGLLHGIYLMINHAWADLCKRLGILQNWQGPSRRAIAIGLTFLAAAAAWIPFRAMTFSGAGNIFEGLVSTGHEPLAALPMMECIPWIAVGLLIVFFAPNSMQIMARTKPALEYLTAPDKWPAREIPTFNFRWRPTLIWSLLATVLFAVAFVLIGRGSEFIYFQF